MSIFKRYVDPALRDLLRRAGLSVRRYPPRPVDLRGVTDDPIAARYLVAGQAALLEVPLERCRGLAPLGFSLGPDTPHPFVSTARALLADPRISYERSPLRIYYENFQPARASEVLDFRTFHAPQLAALPPLAASEPWEARSPEEIQAVMESLITQENHAQKVHLDASQGVPFWGPVIPKKGAIEIERLRKICASIQRKGFKRHDGLDGDVTGDLLLNGTTWAIRLRGGQHRAAVLAALGFERVPIRIPLNEPRAVVYRQDVNQWPQVRNGLFTADEALAIFDRIWAANPPPQAVEAAQLAASLCERIE